MDLSKQIARVRAILGTPRTEWPVIAAEPATIGSIYKDYVLLLAAIPAVFGFLKYSVIGINLPFLGTYRAGVGAGLSGMVVSYVLGLASVYVLSLIVDALAPTFGGQKNSVQAFKAVVYASTASWLAGIGQVVPWIGVLVLLAGGAYSIYLLYLGLPQTMKCPPQKAAGYTAVTFVIAIVLSWLISFAVGGVIGVGSMGGSGLPGVSDSGDAGGFDADSPMGKLESMARQAEEAGKKLEAAQKSGDVQAQRDAAGEMMSAVMSGGDQVESLAPDRIKPFVPESLAGLPRTEVSAERNNAMGMQVSEARGTYADDTGRVLRLEIIDMGGMKGMLAFAGWAAGEQERETDSGYEKTYQQEGRLVHEEWDSEQKSGEYTTVLGERFSVKLSGEASSIAELKTAAASLDLAGLEALRNEGVKPN
jgi:Yip1 domain